MKTIRFFTITLASLFMMFVLTLSLSAQRTVTSNTIWTEGGFTFEFWKDAGGTGSMTTGAGGTFTCTWSGINNILFRSGHRPGSLNQTITYTGSLNTAGNAYLTLYGWTTSPLVEYYVVESWGNWRPPGGTRVGTVTSDGGTYDIFRTERVNQPSIIGTATFPQFWSVRQSRRTSGTITFANHVAAWRALGMNLGSLYEVSMCVEGFQSSGSGGISRLTMGTAAPAPAPPPGGTYEIVVRALGTNGTEQIRLTVGNTTVATWTLTTAFREYRATTNLAGGINVHFINDATGRDVRVDWVRIAGTTRQAEAQTTNTAVWQNNRCGGANSEWMHCNGFIGFAALRSAPAEIEELELVESVASLVPSTTVDVKVFPNPVTGGRLTVVLDGLEGLTTVRITDLNGRTVQVQEVANVSQVDMHIDAQPGIYVMHIINEKQSFVRKIVLN